MRNTQVRLVAVSKLKPANDILALARRAEPPQLHFGENYAQELAQKAGLLPRDIRWHFIGGLQSSESPFFPRPLFRPCPHRLALVSGGSVSYLAPTSYLPAPGLRQTTT